MTRPRLAPILAPILALSLATPAFAQDETDAAPAPEAADRAAERAWLEPFRDARAEHDKTLKKAKSSGPEALKAARLAWVAALTAEERRAAALEAAGGPLTEAAARQRRAVQLERLRLLLYLEAGAEEPDPARVAERRALEAAIEADPELRAAGRRLCLIEARGRDPERYRALLAAVLERRGRRIRARSGPDLALKELAGGPALIWFWTPARPRSLDGAADAARALKAAGGALVLIALEAGREPGIDGARALTAADAELARDLVIDAPPLALLFDAEGALRAVDPGPVGLARALAGVGGKQGS